MSRTRHLGRAVLLASVTAAVAGGLALTGTADAATGTGLTVTRAQLQGGQLLVEGRVVPFEPSVVIESTTSGVTARPDGNGAFKGQATNFTAPDCRVVVDDGRDPVLTVTLTGCTPSAKPVPATPAPPTGSCVISPVPAATVTATKDSVVWFHTTGCRTADVLNWTVAAGVIPTGMSGPSYQGSADGNIIGRPTVRGSYRFTVQVTDQAGQTDQENVSVTVS